MRSLGNFRVNLYRRTPLSFMKLNFMDLNFNFIKLKFMEPMVVEPTLMDRFHETRQSFLVVMYRHVYGVSQVS